MQVPTGKLALPERQVGRSHGTCWQGYFGKRHAVCGVWQGERETMLSGQAWWWKHASLGTHLPIFTVTQEGSIV